MIHEVETEKNILVLSEASNPNLRVRISYSDASICNAINLSLT